MRGGGGAYGRRKRSLAERDPPMNFIASPGSAGTRHNTGYKGRTVIHEILTIDRTIRDMISPMQRGGGDH